MQKPVNLSEGETYPRCRVGDDALVPKNVALARMNVTQSLHSADLETTSQRGSTSRPHIVRPSPTPVGFMIEVAPPYPGCVAGIRHVAVVRFPRAYEAKNVLKAQGTSQRGSTSSAEREPTLCALAPHRSVL